MSTPKVTDDNTMLPVGKMLQKGKYRIDRYISSGGFGNTYLATNVAFDEPVAIKEFFMRDVALRDSETTAVSVANVSNLPVFQEQKEKFCKEARRLRKLHSDHIVAVSDLFDENDTSYYVMDYIDGESLRDMVKRGPLPEKDVRNYLEQTMQALEVVHAQNMFHLDLKPANLMVDKTGRLRVIDFGASKQQKDGGIYSKSAVCYSPGYAPPEQQEQAIDKFGPYTDIYALGATLYNVLTGEAPPKTTDISDEGEDAFHFPSTVSKQMCELIMWMMKTNRKQRPQSVNAIRYFLKGEEPEKKDPPKKIIEKKVPEKKEPEKDVVVCVDSFPDDNDETVLTTTDSNKTYIANNKQKNTTSKTHQTLNNGRQQKYGSSYSSESISSNAGNKLKYIILSCCLAAIIVVVGFFFMNSNKGSADAPPQAESVAEERNYKIKVIAVIMKSADKIDYYALADKGHGKYEVVKSERNYTPADKQVNVAVSSDRHVNQQNNVDALLEEIYSTYSSVKTFFLAQNNLQADPAIKSINDKLTNLNLGITFYNPNQYSGDDAKMVEEFVNQHVKI